MDPQPTSSFIPKKPLAAVPSSGGGMSILVVIGLLFFLVALVGAGGTYLYEKILIQSVKDKEASLTKEQDALGVTTIEDLRRLDNRLVQAKRLLNSHIAPSAIFQYLSTQTLENVQFTSFDYTLQAGGTASLALTGIADSFATVALQSDQFNAANKTLKDVVFSNVNSDQTGKVVFNTKTNVVPALFLYSKAVTPGAEGENTAEPLATTTPNPSQ